MYMYSSLWCIKWHVHVCTYVQYHVLLSSEHNTICYGCTCALESCSCAGTFLTLYLIWLVSVASRGEMPPWLSYNSWESKLLLGKYCISSCEIWIIYFILELLYYCIYIGLHSPSLWYWLESLISLYVSHTCTCTMYMYMYMGEGRERKWMS